MVKDSYLKSDDIHIDIQGSYSLLKLCQKLRQPASIDHAGEEKQLSKISQSLTSKIHFRARLFQNSYKGRRLNLLDVTCELLRTKMRTLLAFAPMKIIQSYFSK